MNALIIQQDRGEPFLHKLLSHEWFYNLGKNSPIISYERNAQFELERFIKNNKKGLIILNDTSDPCIFKGSGSINFPSYVIKKLLENYYVALFSLCDYGRELSLKYRNKKLFFDDFSSQFEISNHPFSQFLSDIPNIHSPRIELIYPSNEELIKIVNNEEYVKNLSPDKFEDLVAEIYYSHGFNVQKVGKTNRGDGGIDLLLTSPVEYQHPMLIGIQIKHSKKLKKIGAPVVRDFVGSVELLSCPVNLGILVSNCNFTKTAKWTADKKKPLIRLKHFQELKEWVNKEYIANNHEWTNIPDKIQLTPSLTIDVPKPQNLIRKL